MTRNPDSDVVSVGTTVVVMCSVMSYPGSSIQWKQYTSDMKVNTIASTVMSDTSSTFRTISNSSITFVSSDINGASRYCCEATNTIGTAEKCLEFTEDGK